MIDIVHNLDDSRPVTAGLNLMIVANAAKGKEMYHEDGGINGDATSDLSVGAAQEENGGSAEGAAQMPDMSQEQAILLKSLDGIFYDVI